MVRFIISGCLLCANLLPIHAAAFSVDTAQQTHKEPLWVQKYRNTHTYYILRTAIPLFVSSAVSLSIDNQIRATRNMHLAQFSTTFDNYLQYAPMAAMFGMKAFGVKGRSSWGEMLTADLISAATMAGLVNGLKYTVKRERPDGSRKNSFPSGHTATAFMAADMLYKEYGQLSPWVGIGAYSAATTVAVGRMLNNRHWMSDVLAGAGIGMVSSELGYFFSDLIFKKKSLTEMVGAATDYTDILSYFEYSVGYTRIFPEQFWLNDCYVCTYHGVNSRLSGAYHFPSGWGIGGVTSIMTANVTKQQGIVGSTSFTIGPTYAKMLIPRFFWESYLYMGYGDLHYNQTQMKSGFNMLVGTSLLGQLTPTMGMRFYTDYTYSSMPFFDSGRRLNYLNVGVAVAALF